MATDSLKPQDAAEVRPQIESRGHRQRGETPQLSDDRTLAEPLLNATEAAQLLHVPRSGLYELVRSRGLPHVRIGVRGLRFTRSGLEDWVGENTHGRTRHS